MNDTIATGHMMRCLAIADAAKSIGQSTVFILADNEAVGLLKERGYEYIVLDTDWNNMESEIGILEQLILKWKINRILIDSYQVTKSYLQKLQKLTEVYYIDDLDEYVYPVKGLICYEINWDSRNYEERYNGTELMVGLQYTPLRTTFSNIKQKQINEKVKNMLLLSGGTDTKDFLNTIINNIDRSQYDRIDVICGRYYEKCDYLRKKYAQYSNVFIWHAVNNIEKFMINADVAISAGGTTLYELCACGTPTISYALADNQLNSVENFQKKGIIDYAGDIRTDNVIDRIRELLNSYSLPQKRKMKSEQMQKIIDGKGAFRIIEKLVTNTKCVKEGQ